MPNNPRKSLRISVLASGEGLTLQAILDAIKEARLSAKVVLVVSNNAEAGALRRAEAAGIATLHLSAATHGEALDGVMAAALQCSGADLVVTAGYMKRLGPLTMAAFPRRMINVHPSLLPKFGGSGMFGDHVHAAVLASGEQETGATVHFVEGDYDSGPPIAQVTVPVMADDTISSLAERVKQHERELLIQVLRQYAETNFFTETNK
ncbi:MAG TPA: phosphoribosylglycinamide formyltransferase [Rhodocyclaceae bacterium]|nr:phosphoribosylglycinamide formyltransferase [Rhodocyclaceae bacterium]